MDQISTSAAILGSARTFLVAGGYNGFSYADIAAVVGIRKASIHHHFPAKADLVHAVVEGYRRDASEGLAALDRAVEDPARKLAAFTGYWQACITDQTAPFCVCAMLAGEKTMLPKPVADGVEAHFRALAGWLTEVMTKGEAEGRLKLIASPRAEAEAFMAIVHGAMLSARAYSDPGIFAVVTDPLLARLRGGEGKL
jgi:TetR/AcrR family transcriptional repressor of nem operon